MGAVAPSRQRPVTRTLSVRLLASTDAGEDLLLRLASRVASMMHVSCQNGSEKVVSHSMPKRSKLRISFTPPVREISQAESLAESSEFART